MSYGHIEQITEWIDLQQIDPGWVLADIAGTRYNDRPPPVVYRKDYGPGDIQVLRNQHGDDVYNSIVCPISDQTHCLGACNNESTCGVWEYTSFADGMGLCKLYRLGGRAGLRPGAYSGSKNCALDLPPTPAVASCLPCSATSLQTSTPPAAAAVCSDSAVNDACFGSGNYSQAEAVCGSLGARLCTAEEVSAGVAADTGCGWDRKTIWTRTSCRVPLSGQEGHVVLAGAPSDDIVATCEAKSAEQGIRCCADRVPDPASQTHCTSSPTTSTSSPTTSTSSPSKA